MLELGGDDLIAWTPYDAVQGRVHASVVLRMIATSETLALKMPAIVPEVARSRPAALAIKSEIAAAHVRSAVPGLTSDLVRWNGGSARWNQR